MKRKVIVYPKKDFKEVDKSRLDTAIISIECTGECRKYYLLEEKGDSDSEHILPSGNRVLNLDFDDLDHDREYKGHHFKTITEEQAIEAVNFIEANIGKDFIIHCGAGRSRSQGFFRFIIDTYPDYYEECEENKRNPCITPNMEVVRKLKAAHIRKHGTSLIEPTLEHPWFDFGNQVSRLLKTWKEHQNIVVGFDFDGTIYDTNGIGGDFSRVIELLKECSDLGLTMCLWTAERDEEKLKWKIEYSKSIGIKVDYINESPLMPGTTKPYFNILLDDRSGLPYTFRVLKETLRIIKTQEPYV